MPTENNDYVNWVVNHTAEEENHKKNQILNKKSYTLKECEYNYPAEYEQLPMEYEQLPVVRESLCKALKDDPKWRQMSQKELEEQARIQLRNQQYTTQQTRFGPYA